MSAALVLGRFQPPHKGHEHVIGKALAARQAIVVAIGSAQQGMTRDDPFTAGERYALLLSMVPRGRAALVPVPDLGRYALWVRHVESYCPRFDLVVTGSAVTRLLFEEAGYEVLRVEHEHRAQWSGTHIRRLMASGGDWKQHVPGPVADHLESIGGPQRVRRLAAEVEGS